jgi:hypothetical protein
MVPASDVNWHQPAGPEGVHVGTDPPPGTIYHHPWWLDATTDAQWTCVTAGVRAGFTARLPTFRPTGRLRRRVLTNPPLTRMLGPVFDRVHGDGALTEDTAQRLTADLVAQLPSGASFSQVFAPEARGLFSFRHAGYRVQADYTFWLTASASRDDGWLRIHPKTRRQLRRAGDQYHVDRAVGVDEFVAFYVAAKRADGQRPVVPDAPTIRALLTAALARSHGRLLGCRTSHGALASVAFVAHDADTAHLVMTARDAAVAHSGAVGLLVWDAVLWARDSQRAFDFDGSTHFLSQFGGKPRMRWAVSRMRPSDRALRWAGLI